jgi:hypothetical protein
MPRGDKSSYTDKQKRQARHIEEGYEDRGVSEKEAERRAWVTVNKQDHGGKKSGSGVGRAKDTSSAPATMRRSHRPTVRRRSARNGVCKHPAKALCLSDTTERRRKKRVRPSVFSG